MTTAKNNFCYPGATAPGFKSAARFAARKKLLFLQVVSVVSKRTYRQERVEHVDDLELGRCPRPRKLVNQRRLAGVRGMG